MFVKEAIEKIQNEHKVDQYGVKDLIGTSQGTVSNYLSGKSYPQLEPASVIWLKFGYRCEPFTQLALDTYADKYLR